MIAYKGFNEGLVCRGYKFKMGLNTTPKAQAVACGFHCAENPLDCLSYYGDMERSEYYIVNAGGDIDEDDRDSKIACTELTIIKKLSKEDFILHALAFMADHPKRAWNAHVKKDRAETNGYGFAIARGQDPIAKGHKKGDILAFAKEDECGILEVAMVVVDGKWIKAGKQIPDDIICFFASDEVEPEALRFISDRMSEVQIYNYLRKQILLSGMRLGEMLTTWKDYLAMAKKFGMDANDSIIYKASKLKQRHDELVLRGQLKDMEKEAQKVAEKYPHVEQILRQIKDIYSYEGKEYTVIVPDGIADIMVEGRNLSHCVATSDRYMDRIERKESYVVFLRKTQAPKQSYYTLEIEPDGTVRQKRTMFDRQHPDIEDANKFLKQWQKEVAKRLTDSDRELAKKSKELRIEGFAQMSRDRVTINTGTLRGKLLVDVLMADLMENEERCIADSDVTADHIAIHLNIAERDVQLVDVGAHLSPDTFGDCAHHILAGLALDLAGADVLIQFGVFTDVLADQFQYDGGDQQI